MGDNALFVTSMGMGTVFVGLICIVVICVIMSAVIKAFNKKEETKNEEIKTEPVKNAAIPNKQEFIAAVSAVIAEEMGTDITGIRIHSVKQI